MLLWSVKVIKEKNDMPNQRDQSKKCVAAWLDAELINEWRDHCESMKKSQTDRIQDLILRDLKGSIPQRSPVGAGRGGQRV